MDFDLDHAVRLLQQTPSVLESLVKDLPERWARTNEGGETWSPYDVVGHFIHGEKTDWIPRLEIILSDRAERRFEPFDRFAQFEQSEAKSIHDLLAEFRDLRERNMTLLTGRNLITSDLERTGTHPTFGTVTLRQLLAAWVVHDLNHIAQISRVMAAQYKEEVGPWTKFLRILS